MNEVPRSFPTRDEEAARSYLDAWKVATWGGIAVIVGRMKQIRAEHPDGNYPTPTHGIDEIGACPECDAIRCLNRLAAEDAVSPPQ